MIKAERYFLRIADAVSEQSTCLDKNVGCVIVSQDNQIISCGYNGAPSKIVDCKTQNQCQKTWNNRCLATHAEINALIKADERAKGGKIFVSLEPCYECAKAIINAGIKEVWFSRYNDKQPEYKIAVSKLLEAVNIKYAYYPIGEN